MLFAQRLALLAPLFASLALVACSGAVTKIGPGGGDAGPNPECPSPQVVAGGGSCSDPGLQCSATETLLPTCDGQGSTTTVECTCGNGVWECPVVAGAPSCPADPVCPTPSSITQGGSCYADPTLDCPSTIPLTDCYGNDQGYASCNCESSTWQCESSGPACVIDASAPCPDPSSVFAGQGCATYGTTCSGDPQVCDGTTVYDTLQCEAGQWSVVASTTCEATDAGFVDAQTVDGGQGI